MMHADVYSIYFISFISNRELLVNANYNFLSWYNRVSSLNKTGWGRINKKYLFIVDYYTITEF